MMLTPESFNAMIKTRNGRLPIRVVRVINANRDDFDAFVRDNKSFYESFGFTVLKKESVISSDVENDKNLIFTMNNPIVNNYSTERMIIPHFDLQLEKSETVCIKRFVNELCFDGLNMAIFDTLPCRDKLVAMLMNENDYQKALIATLEQHFCTSTNGIFKESDFDWLKDEDVPVTKDDAPKSVEKPAIEESANEEPVVENTVASSVPEPEFIIPEPASVETDTEEETDNNETLTSEEVEENDRLLAEIRKAYEECKAVIEGSCNSLFVPIKNRIKECLETNDFSTQLCLMYLEVSQDTSSPVYKKIYDTDKLTARFNDSVHRQTIKMGCPCCGHQWYEDITFKKKGIIEVFCPKCNVSRLIEK